MNSLTLGCLVLALVPAAAHAAARLTGDLPRRADPGFRTQEVPEGLKIREVTADSPAARAGLKAGDRLLAVGGRPVSSSRDGRELLRRVPGGRLARIAVEREGRRIELSFTPGRARSRTSPASTPSTATWRCRTAPGSAPSSRGRKASPRRCPRSSSRSGFPATEWSPSTRMPGAR